MTNTNHPKRSTHKRISKRSKSSKAWLDRQHADEFTRKSKQEGFRSRAVYKLLEIQAQDQIFSAGMKVVDLGAAPGGWSQLATKYVGERGRIVAIDILPIDPIPNVDIIVGDFREQSVVDQLKDQCGTQVDLVLSDMSPNFTGNSHVDMPSAIYLAELGLDFAKGALKPNGCMVVKLFQGEGFTAYLQELKRCFAKVVTRKPKASRPESREIYAVAKNYRG